MVHLPRVEEDRERVAGYVNDADEEEIEVEVTRQLLDPESDTVVAVGRKQPESKIERYFSHMYIRPKSG